MNLVVWVVVIGGVICGIVIAAGWLLSVMGTVLKGAADTAGSGATSLLDLLGKKRLIRLYEPPQDLLDLEAKLEAEDIEKYQLKRYAPEIYKPEPLKEARYTEELPKLLSLFTT